MQCDEWSYIRCIGKRRGEKATLSSVFGNGWGRGDIYFLRRVNDDNGNKEKRRRGRRAN